MPTHFIMRRRFINLCFIYIQITIITVAMQTQTKSVFALLKLKLIFFSVVPRLIINTPDWSFS